VAVVKVLFYAYAPCTPCTPLVPKVGDIAPTLPVAPPMGRRHIALMDVVCVSVRLTVPFMTLSIGAGAVELATAHAPRGAIYK